MNRSHSYMSHSLHGSDRLARGLGWFSIGLGLYKMLAPRKLTEPLGMEGFEPMVRACGAREIACGVGALSTNPSLALWSRVGGDAMDLAALAAALRDKHNPKKENVGVALAAVGAITALDLVCASRIKKRYAYQAGPTPDYSDRSGFPRPAEAMRGTAGDFETPRDMRAALPSPAKSPGERVTPTTRSPNG
ncbi:hypothetical protein [Modicisalibacter xianhensis]|uniref:Cyclase dehydrase n=1 Tax=Modicisalibacter xianhensis TaxID=442341 RepID=A0A1I3C8W0_9GAMM|nr:hypothetical protein [Halomonas xianhensis]SFH70984.1 hypothetical protein SAMN04487959_10874 [Halomonas xianhensis]